MAPTGVSDVAQVLSVACLVLGLVLLALRRIAPLIATGAAQSWSVAAAAAWQGHLHDSLQLYLAALITLAAGGLAIPIALRRVARRLRVRDALDTTLEPLPSLALGLLLVALGMLVTPTTTTGPSREALAMALGAVLLASLLMVIRRNALALVVGFTALANGVVLTATGVIEMASVAALSAAMLALVGCIVAGVAFCGVRERFESIDSRRHDQTEPTPR